MTSPNAEQMRGQPNHHCTGSSKTQQKKMYLFPTFECVHGKLFLHHLELLVSGAGVPDSDHGGSSTAKYKHVSFFLSQKQTVIDSKSIVHFGMRRKLLKITIYILAGGMRRDKRHLRMIYFCFRVGSRLFVFSF